MKSTKTDVFFNRDLTLDAPLTINGNLYVNGNAGFISNNGVVEVFGDAIIEGDLSVDKIIVHGDLYCKNLDCISAEADENITVTCVAEANLVQSNHGSINIADYADASTIVASEGSIFIGGIIRECSSIYTLKAFDKIELNATLLDAVNIVAGAGICVNGVIWFDSSSEIVNEPVSISTYTGGIISKNIKVN